LRLARFVLAAALLPAAGLAAQSGLPPQPFEAARANGALTATLVSIDATRLVVQADNGEVVTFVVDATSSIPPGLVPGSRVSVRYDVADGDRYRVASVGIPKIPLEPGSTTDPPPTAPASQDATPAAPAEAPLAAGKGAEPVPAAGASPEDAVTGIPAAGGTSQPPPSEIAASMPSSDRASAAPMAPPGGTPPQEARPGRDAIFIGGGLALVTAALGLLLLIRR